MSNELTSSEKIIGHIIGRAAPNGVRHTEIVVSDFDPEATEDTVQTFDDAVEWLCEEGLIRVKGDPVNDDERDDIWH